MEKALLINVDKRNLFEISDYKNELELQELIKDNPSLVNISAIFDSPLLMIAREALHIDVLALTSDCVPVIIECKRKNNPDMRYLIAQIFEYASLLQTKSYGDIVDIANRFFSSGKCAESKYKNHTFYENFSVFIKEHGNDDYTEEGSFQARIDNNLKSGQFYCVIVVDSLDENTRRSIDFFNDKLEKLRIEVIEVKKLKSNGMSIYIPFHANPPRQIVQEKNTPGRISFNEMIEKGTLRQAEIVKEIVDFWCNQDDCKKEMGTTGLSLRYKQYSLFWVFIDRMHIANPLSTQLEREKKDVGICEILKEKIQAEYKKKQIFFDEKGISIEKLKNTIVDILNTFKERIE